MNFNSKTRLRPWLCVNISRFIFSLVSNRNSYLEIVFNLHLLHRIQQPQNHSDSHDQLLWTICNRQEKNRNNVPIWVSCFWNKPWSERLEHPFTNQTNGTKTKCATSCYRRKRNRERNPLISLSSTSQPKDDYNSPLPPTPVLYFLNHNKEKKRKATPARALFQHTKLYGWPHWVTGTRL